MRSAVIVDAVRTPLGKRNGKLKDWHPADLASLVLRAIVDRTDLDPAAVDDVIELAKPVLRHRMVPTFNAEADGVTVDDIVDRVLKVLPRGKVKAV